MSFSDDSETSNVDLKPLVDHLSEFIAASRLLQKAELANYNLRNKDVLLKKTQDLQSSLFTSLLDISSIDLLVHSKDSTVTYQSVETQIKNLFTTAETKSCSINKVRPIIADLKTKYSHLKLNTDLVHKNSVQYILNSFLGIHCTALDNLEEANYKAGIATNERLTIARDHEKLRQELVTSSTRETELEEALAELKHTYQKHIEDHFAQVTHYQKELTTTRDLLNSTASEHEKSIETSTTDKTELETNFLKAQREYQRLTSDLDAVNTELATLKDLLSDKESEINQLKSDSIKQKQLRPNVMMWQLY